MYNKTEVSLLDIFAAQAMAALLQRKDPVSTTDVVTDAYSIAAMMVEERQRILEEEDDMSNPDAEEKAFGALVFANTSRNPTFADQFMEYIQMIYYALAHYHKFDADDRANIKIYGPRAADLTGIIQELAVDNGWEREREILTRAVGSVASLIATAGELGDKEAATRIIKKLYECAQVQLSQPLKRR